MEIRAEIKQVRVTPRKMKLLLKTLRKFSLPEMLSRLEILNKSGAVDVLKLIKSAINNAEKNFNLKQENLKVKELSTRVAGMMKRMRPASRGVGHGYKKRMCHVKVVLEG